jgi:hypothetical protein
MWAVLLLRILRSAADLIGAKNLIRRNLTP